MATIKSYTDLKQSKKLAEILPLESADMGYLWNGTSFCKYPVGKQTIYNRTENIPCWSLAALLSVIRKTIGYTLYGVNNVYISCELGDFRKIETEVYDNEVDACYEMVLKLHELKWL